MTTHPPLPRVLLAGLFVPCILLGSATGPATRPQDRGLELLATWLSGSFSSEAQAKAKPEDFRDIRLHVVRIWPERADGPWLYVEQAAAESLDAPYRQRVYHVVGHPDGSFESVVFTLPDPARFAGAWKDPARFSSLAPEALAERAGCSIRLHRREDGAFAGSTEGRACPSDRKGAAYATSEVVLTAERMVSWDRGFDAEGKQVWGATAGGYVFERVAGR